MSEAWRLRPVKGKEMAKMSDARVVLERLKPKPDGPVKKFELVKVFGKALPDHGIDPYKLSCAELVERIEAGLKAAD